MIGDRNRKNGKLGHYSYKITFTVKLTHDEVRSKLYSSKKKLKGQNFLITESLTSL